MKITKTSDFHSNGIKVLIYGKSGVGKTSTALKLDEKKTLILSAESGLMPLKGRSFDVVKVERWPDVADVHKHLVMEEYQDKYDTIFIDSLTELNEVCKDHIVKNERPAMGKVSSATYADMMTIQDWGLLGIKMNRMVRMFRDLPYNIIFTCLEETVKNDQTGALSFEPSLNGKFAVNVAQYFDEVFRMVAINEGEEIQRYFNTCKDPKNLVCKDRSDSLDKKEVADLSAVFNKIKGNKKTNKKENKNV